MSKIRQDDISKILKLIWLEEFGEYDENQSQVFNRMAEVISNAIDEAVNKTFRELKVIK